MCIPLERLNISVSKSPTPPRQTLNSPQPFVTNACGLPWRGGGFGNGILKLQSDLNYFIPRYNHWAVTQPVPHFKFLELKGGDGGIITVDTGEHSLGFCEDLSPDDKLYKVLDNLFISSQDGARNLEELHQNNITHILNVGIGIQNAFPKVIGHCWTWFSRFDNNIIPHLFLSSSKVLNLHILFITCSM